MAIRLSVSVLVAVLTGSASAQTIVSWGDGTPGTDFQINNQAGTIEILRGASNAYKFYAVDGTGNPGTGVINNITIASGATGDFSLLIDHPTSGLPGALNWRAGDLRYSGGTCTITGIDLSGTLVTSPGSTAPLDIFCEVVSGNITAAALSTAGGAGNPLIRRFVADSVTGNITLTGMDGDLEIGTFNGSLTVGDTPLGRTSGDVRIGSAYSGTITLNDPTGYDGDIDIAGDFSGQIVVEDVMQGTVEIGTALVPANLVAPGRMHFKDSLDRTNGDEPPSVRIHGSITGTGTAPVIEVGTLTSGGGLIGTIAIDGDLNNVNTSGPEIQTQTITHSSRGAIVVDYDGWDSGDDWASLATIAEYHGSLLFATYSCNSPSAGVFEVTPCLGDLNNDGMLTPENANQLDDVTALKQARLYTLTGGAHRDCYVDNFAGLEGSLSYHGDLNGDAIVDCIDIDWLEHLAAGGPHDCCITDTAMAEICRADIDHSGTVNLPDLGVVLAAYNLCEGTTGYSRDGDFNYSDCASVSYTLCSSDAIDVTNCVDLSDLGVMLAVYGMTCDCFGGSMAMTGGGGGEDPAFIEWVPKREREGTA